MNDAFFYADGDGWRATDCTIGPWSPQFQHAGPPAALLGRALEAAVGDGFRFARLNFEILRPVPVVRLTLQSELTRAGKMVRYAQASLHDGEGRLVMQATGLAIREARLDFGLLCLPEARTLPGPEHSAAFDFPVFSTELGYHTAMELRRAEGEFGAGPCAMWMRMRVPLVAGEAPSPLQRVLCAADSGNGVSMVLDKRRFSFMNPDLTVYLHRYPRGEWLCLDAATTPDADGIGLAESQLRDEDGPIGRGCQSLLIAPN